MTLLSAASRVLVVLLAAPGLVAANSAGLDPGKHTFPLALSSQVSFSLNPLQSALAASQTDEESEEIITEDGVLIEEGELVEGPEFSDSDADDPIIEDPVAEESVGEESVVEEAGADGIVVEGDATPDSTPADSVQSDDDIDATETAGQTPVSDPVDEELIYEEEQFLVEEGEESIEDVYEEEFADDEELFLPVEQEDVAEDVAQEFFEEPGEFVEEQPVEVQPEPVENTAGQQLKAPADTAKEEIEATIEKARSINFADNLKEYRSPKLAMLLSLIVPGLGQAYSRAYWKTGLFLALEAGIVTTSALFYHKGNELEKEQRAHADSAYSYENFRQFYDSLYAEVVEFAEKQSEPNVKHYADSVVNEVVFGFLIDRRVNDDSIDYTFDTTFFRSEHVDQKSNRFYKLIGYDRSHFVMGWNDSRPESYNDVITYEQLDKTGYKGRDVLSIDSDTVQAGGGSRVTDEIIVTSSATDDLIPLKFSRLQISYMEGDTSAAVDVKSLKENVYGFSHLYDTYRDIIFEKETNYRRGQSVLLLLIVNHIASAIDAGITAKRHNDRLLQKRSFWHRIDVEQQWVNTGSERAPGLALKVKF
ncbi:MAG: hypothetical protein GF398_11825 [Chitinivibrionales bacterium]|nr:hypothetical protein [Chitinivibrionales bacterium]